MFLSVRPCERELDIKKSRFIASSYMISCRADVKPIVAELWEKHPESRHICYAFVADETGDDFGYDDDGEPSGTAGKPIYSALAASGAVKSLIAVVRYFGGIKLGAGGLTRAYRTSAAELIEQAGLARTERCDVYSAECDGDAYRRITAILRNTACKTERILYSDKVSFTVIAPHGEDVARMLVPLGAVVDKTGERYITVSEGV